MPAIPTRRMYEHWVCFGCCKMFKKKSRWEGVHPSEDEAPIPNHICPECKKQMRDMGSYFEPPKKLNKKMWQIMRLLADNGYTFHSEGYKAFIQSQILGDLSLNINQIKLNILALKHLPEGERLLHKVSQK